MVHQDEVRRASISGPVSSATTSATLKLPALFTARPGNVGVQIDAHRAMNVLSHPRSAQFTSQFHGGMYENGSLENYSRVVERTAQRAKLLQDKLEKLRAREQYLEDDEIKRKQRRVQREAARQRRIWRMNQAAKRADERAQETTAAVAVQKMVRGVLARQMTRVLKQIRKTDEAASMLQRAMKTYVCRQQLERERERRVREEEERRELEMHSAAAVLQRQARKRLKVVQEERHQIALAAFAEDEENEDDNESEGGDGDEASLTSDERPPSATQLSADEKIIAEALSRGISLDLLFSDEEDNESAHPTNSTSSSSIPPSERTVHVEKTLPQPPPPESAAVRRLRRPMSIKRVGGGYRTKRLPYNTTEPSPAKETASNSVPATTRTPRGRALLQDNASAPPTTVSEEFMQHARRSPTVPKAAVSPTFLSPSTPAHPSRATATSKKSDSDEVRAASPVKTSSPPKVVSPYAVPQRLRG